MCLFIRISITKTLGGLTMTETDVPHHDSGIWASGLTIVRQLLTVYHSCERHLSGKNNTKMLPMSHHIFEALENLDILYTLGRNKRTHYNHSNLLYATPCQNCQYFCLIWTKYWRFTRSQQRLHWESHSTLNARPDDWSTAEWLSLD